MDRYTHESYTVVRATELIQDAVDHILSIGEPKVPEELRKELHGWKRQKARGEEGEQSKDEGVEDLDAVEEIPFELVRRIHEQLKDTPMGEGRVYLHELLEGSELVLPALVPPQRNPELVARLGKIRAKVEQKEYNRMVSNVDPVQRNAKAFQLGLEVQATSRQMWAVVNFFFTVIASFVFGYFAAYFAGFDVPGCVFIGLIFGTAAFIADIYFLVRTPDQPKPLQLKPSKPLHKPR